MCEDEDCLKSENALQRFARLQIRPSLITLEPNLFPNGPLPGEIIEIFGDLSVGKTFMLLEFIKKVILPKSFRELSIPGLDSDVIYLNTDIHFNILTLNKLLSTYLLRCIPNQFPRRGEVVNEIVKNSLKKLTVLNIYDSETLYTTFHLLQRLLLQNEQVSLIIIDSISSFYWQDRMAEGIKKMDLYVSSVLKQLHHSIGLFKVTLIFTRPSYFQTKLSLPTDCSSVYKLRNINTSICLKTSLRDSGSSHKAEIRTASAFFVKFFSISEYGILWSL